MQYKLSKLIVGLTAAFVFSGQASANSVSELATGNGSFIKQGTGINANSFTSYNIGPFTDSYTVTVTSPLAELTTTLLAITSSTGKGNSVTIPTGTLSETLLNSAGQAVSFYKLTTGTYTLDVNALSTAEKGYASYTLTANVAAIPEPTESALLLSGLGLMGFIATRRGRKQA